MTSKASEWFMLTPAGVLHAFMKEAPGETELALQALLTGERALDAEAWAERSALAGSVATQAIQEGWVQVLQRPLQGPDAKLDDFLQHVIASLSGERRAVLASEGGFCLGRSGIDQDEADALSAAAADYSDFATRQARRGWRGLARAGAARRTRAQREGRHQGRKQARIVLRFHGCSCNSRTPARRA